MIEFEDEQDVALDTLETERSEEVEREADARRMERFEARRAQRKEDEAQAAPAEGEHPGLPNRPPGGNVEFDFTDFNRKIDEAEPISVVGLAKTIGEGAINAPGNIIGGGISAAAEAFETVGDLIDDGNRALMDMGVPAITFDEDGSVSTTTDFDELDALPNTAEGIRNKGEQLPVIGEEDSAVRAMSKFFTGFAAAGKALKGTQLATKLASGGYAGQSGLAALKGAISDFAFMDEMDNPANVLVESFPSLEGDVTEFFDADEGDSDVEKRLKNAMTGLGMGVVTDSTIGALRGIRSVMRARQGLQSIDEAVDSATAAIKTQNAVQKEDFNRLLGDVDAPMFSTRKAVDAVVEEFESAANEAGDFITHRPSRSIDDLSDHARVLVDEAENLGGRRIEALASITDAKRSELLAKRGIQRTASGVVDDPDEVFINWARIDSEDDVKEMIQQLADNDSAEIAMNQRGVRSHIDTEQAASQLNAWDTLTSRRHGEAMNAEQALASRKLWASSGRKVLELSEAASVKDASPAAQIAFRKQLALHSTIQRQVIGARTETARALNSWRIPAGDDFAFFGQMEALTSELERGVPTRRLAENIRTLHAMGDMSSADTFMYGAGRIQKLARGAEHASAMMRQFWYFSLLSRFTTHIRNLTGNSARLGMEVMDRRVASMIGELAGNQHVPTGEAAALMHGQVMGAKEAFFISSASRRAMKTASKLMKQGDAAGAREAIEAEADGFGTFWKSAATGDSGFGIGKVDARASGAFAPETLGLDPESNWGRFFNFVDTTTSTPGRALAAGDEIFKTMSFNGERHAQAFRRATEELNAGKIADTMFDARVAEIANDPDEAIKLLMRDAAERNTFTNDPGNGAIWEVVKKVNRVPVLGRLAMPFQRTPYNIANEGLRRSPIGALMPGFWRDLAEGGAKADIAWSKLLTGNAILLGMADLAMNGTLVGERPRISRESGRRAAESRMDVRSMTFRLDQGNGETLNIPFRGFEPITFPMGLAANLVEIMDSDDFRDPNKETENLLIAASGALAMQMTSANYMRGISEFFAFMSEPNRYGGNYFEGIARSMMPGVASQFVTGQDPYIREINGFADAFMAQVPVASKSLPFRRDIWGKPLERNAPGVLGSIMPYTTKEADQEPIDRELMRLEYFPTAPKKTSSFPIMNPGLNQDSSVSINLNKYPGAHSRMLELAGQVIKEPLDVEPPDGVDFVNPPANYFPEGRGLMGDLNALVNGSHGDAGYYQELSDGPDGGKAHFIQAITNYYRRVARFQLMEEFPEIQAEVESRRDEAPRKFMYEMEYLQQ